MNQPDKQNDEWSRSEWEQLGDRVFDALKGVHLPGRGDTTRSAFDTAFVGDIAALQALTPMDYGMDLARGALQIAGVRVVLGDAASILSDDQVNQLGNWYLRRLVSRIVATMLGTPAPVDTAADEKMITLFSHHADVNTPIEFGPDGRARRKVDTGDDAS